MSESDAATATTDQTPSAEPGSDPKPKRRRSDTATNTDTDTGNGRGHADMQTIPATPEALDDTVQTTTIRGWIALVAIAVAVLLAGIWAFVGTVPQQTSTQAVVDQPGGTYDITAGTEGSVVVTVAEGASISEGDAVATVTPTGPDGTSPLTVTSPVAGTVGNILVREGQGVEATETVLSIREQASGDSTNLVTFLSASSADRYTVGAEVDVEIPDVTDGSTTYATAKVANVASTPSPLTAMEAALPSDDLANEFNDDANGVAYRIDLALDDSSMPDSQRPAQGQVVKLTNTYDEVHPVDLMFGN